MQTILVVDDDKQVLDLVSIHLSRAGFQTMKALDGKEALQLVERALPALAVVDVMMPGMDGFTLTTHLRALDIPVLLLTAKGALEDKERGFSAGSDDYVVKPFEPEELVYRVRAILRRYDKDTDTLIHVGPLEINRLRYEVTIDEKTLYLPLKEFELLSVLASRVHHVFSRELLIERVWGIDYEGDEQTLNVHVNRLREKLRPLTKDIQIITVRGIGYKLEVVQ